MLLKQRDQNSKYNEMVLYVLGRTYVLPYSVPEFLIIDWFIKRSKQQAVKHHMTRYFVSVWYWTQSTFLIIRDKYTKVEEFMLIICTLMKFTFKGAIPSLAIKVFKPAS